MSETQYQIAAISSRYHWSSQDIWSCQGRSTCLPDKVCRKQQWRWKLFQHCILCIRKLLRRHTCQQCNQYIVMMQHENSVQQDKMYRKQQWHWKLCQRYISCNRKLLLESKNQQDTTCILHLQQHNIPLDKSGIYWHHQTTHYQRDNERISTMLH